MRRAHKIHVSLTCGSYTCDPHVSGTWVSWACLRRYFLLHYSQTNFFLTFSHQGSNARISNLFFHTFTRYHFTVAWALPSSPSHHLLLPLLFHVLRAKVRQRSDNEKGRYKKKRHAKVWLIREGQISFWANNEFRPKFSKIFRNGWNEPKWGEIEFEVELRVFPFRFACWYEKFRPFWSEWNEIQNID